MLRQPCLLSYKALTSSPSTPSQCRYSFVPSPCILIFLHRPGIQPGGYGPKELSGGARLHCRGRSQPRSLLLHLLLPLANIPHPLLAATSSRGDARPAQRLHRLLPRHAGVGGGRGAERDDGRKRLHTDRLAALPELHTSGLQCIAMLLEMGNNLASVSLSHFQQKTAP